MSRILPEITQFRGGKNMVVYWAFESIDKILNQSAFADLTLQLGKEEQALLELLRFKKRRDEWLAGRLALKKLLTKVLPEFSGLEHFRIQILKAESGAPTLLIDSTQPVHVSISLSHSNGYLLCAVSQLSPNMGVDLELI
jgi:4'-phosphopantetheinyl transferase